MPPTGRKAKAKTASKKHQVDNAHARLMDELTQFQWFKDEILPAIRADLKSGVTADKLREKYSALIQARMITTALIERDAGKRTLAGKDILDRAEGKAKERKEINHHLSNLNDEELRSTVMSSIEDLDDIDINPNTEEVH